MKYGLVEFAAELYLRTHEEGGRKTPIKSGFRTDIVFDKKSRIAVIKLSKDMQFLFPGESCDVRLRVLLHSYVEIDEVQNAKEVTIMDASFRVGELKRVEVVTGFEINWKYKDLG